MIYLDNSATTKPNAACVQAMTRLLCDTWGNPSSVHELGIAAERELKNARKEVAASLGAEPDRVFFTSGGTEADNWAIKGVAHTMAKKGKKHLITSVFEHHAVLHTMDALRKEGFEITELPVTPQGLVRVEDVAAAIREDTALVTIMYANNEIGTIQPIAEIGKVCHEKGVLFHTDAVQAVGNVPIDVKEQNIDLLSLSGHKLHGPKGVGALYIRRGIVIPNLIDGGAQEKSKRAGTENVAGIVGLATAMEIACNGIEERASKVKQMRDRLIDGLLQIPRCRLNGDRERRLPGNVNISFEGVEGESLLLWLDQNGICASSGSACTSGSLDPSHVLIAIGLPHEVAHGSLRLTLGEFNTTEDVDYILEVVPGVIEKLRAMSPLWERIIAQEK